MLEFDAFDEYAQDLFKNDEIIIDNDLKVKVAEFEFETEIQMPIGTDVFIRDDGLVGKCTKKLKCTLKNPLDSIKP